MLEDVVRDTERTRLRLLNAATSEFAAHGLHGTTVGRIAARAGVNRERLYAYFGDLSMLFSTVIGTEVDKVAAAVPLVIDRPEDVGEFVGRTFDYQHDHPDLSRLMLWEGLADIGVVPDEINRSVLYQEKIAVIAAAQHSGVIQNAVAPAHLMFLLLALTSWWAGVPQIARMLTGENPHDPDDRLRRRQAVVQAAIRLVQP